MDNNRFDISIGRKYDKKLFSSRVMGQAQYCDEFQHFTVRLWMLPRARYFVKRNFDSLDTYTIYARELKDETECKLLEPVGIGTIATDLKDYIQLKFNMFPHLGIFLGLYPKSNN